MFAAFAQSDRGTITGTISDPAGAVIANAAIEARNVATGAVFSVASSATGNYTIAQLPAGGYQLTVTVAGFKKFVRAGLVVEVAGTLRVDATLEVGSAAESVTVTEATPLLKTEGGDISHNVSTESMDNLPILTLTPAAGIGTANSLGNIRNPLAAVGLLPGSRITTDSVMRINGMPSNSQAINIEGQDATNGFFKQQNQISQAGMDAIQEVAIQTSNSTAEYGQAGGGYFNYTMKSGTNQLHASAYDYFVNEAFNAGLPFTDAGFTATPLKAGQHVRNPIRQNDYGFTVGGPIRIPKVYNGQDKSFFFFNFEQFRQAATISNTIAVVPTAAQRAGDFSAALGQCATVAPTVDPINSSICLNQVFDPNTTRAVNGITVRDPFPGNKIELTRIDPTAKIIQDMIPQANRPGLFNYTPPTYSNFRHTTIPSFKIDHSLNDRMKLSGYYSATKTYSPQNNGFPQPFTATQPQNALSHTVRLNWDYSATPTLLLHLGAGILRTSNPQTIPDYDQKPLFPQGLPFAASYFPYLAGMYSTLGGGWNGGGGFPVGNTSAAFTLTPEAYDTKPTFNASATWVKANHTFKLGATAVFEGIQSVNASRANGQFGYLQQQTADPAQFGQPFSNTASSGFGYASFFLGQPNNVALAIVARPRLGTHSYGMYIQDNWKITRKLTFDYGLRWDYAILWKEQYGRMQSAAFDQPNLAIGGRKGTVQYEATCKCHFSSAYPYAIGPHLGLAYQINPKTVFRAGGSISYGSVSDQAGLNSSAGDFYSVASPGYGIAAGLMKDGNPYGPGNRFGNKPVTWPDFDPLFPFPASQSPLVVPPASPFVSIAPNAGRLPRIFQWSVGFQREVMRDLVVDASYVGNRSAWFVAPLLSPLNYNALTPEVLKSRYNIDITNRTDTALLNTPISSPLVTARFPWLANPNSVYPGFPVLQPLKQALRDYPQWNGIPPFLGPPNGNTWYDSLQIKATKRYSHGLNVQLAYAWQKELTNGTNSNTSYVTPSAPLINDVYNKLLNKQISGFSQPQTLTISFNYTTPKLPGDRNALKALSWAVRDWTFGGVLSYRSGQILPSPPSANNLLDNLARGPANNPALWGGGFTLLNRVAGQPLFTVDPNSKFDPTKTLVLNTNAWVEPPYGTFGASAPYFNDFRWQRQPSESIAFGRMFPIGKEGKYRLQIRAEFQNVLNRTFYSLPSIGAAFASPTVTITTPTGRANSLSGTSGLLSSGFGYVNWVNGGSFNALGTGAAPRSGQLVARFQF
ncbi:MAG TPA: TonB-dependent receptor [Bryobacteraceae bacterium]|nr:TonB-dependent receptor [Bryobacteraceae bacterium]